VKTIASATAGALLALLFLSTPASSATLNDDPDARASRVELWLKAVLHHVPGNPDAPLVEIAGRTGANWRCFALTP